MTLRPAPVERALVALGAVGLVVGLAVVAVAPAPPPTKGPPPPPVAAALALFVPGCLLVVGSVRTVVGGWRMRAWPRVAGVVAEARSMGAPYVYVRCRYTVGGAAHEVDDVRLGTGGRFRAGETVAVRVDPADPARAVLEPALRPGAAAALAVGVVVVGLSASLLA